ncbi:MAG: hypothetical protein AB3N20_11615 [Rhizobiaceae bacterium]
MPILVAGALFLVFFANVLVGAVTGSPILGDVSEMLILFVASIFFVVAILRREADARSADNQ